MSHLSEIGLVLAVLLIAILCSYIWFLSYTRKKKKEKISRALSRVEKSMDLVFQFVDHLALFTIAMDPAKKTIVQISYQGYQTSVITLNDTVNCRLEEKKQGNHTQLIQLLLLNKNEQTCCPIVFYRQYHDQEAQLKHARQTATNWKIMINRIICVPVL